MERKFGANNMVTTELHKILDGVVVKEEMAQ
jgi:hypothetical protein